MASQAQKVSGLSRNGPLACFELALACARLSVSEDDRKIERAKNGISCERDPGVKRRGRESL